MRNELLESGPHPLDIRKRANASGVPGRGKSVTALLTGVALMHTAMVGVSAVATLFIADAVGAWWSGAPNTAAVLGTATGTLALSTLMTRRGRRAGLTLGYATAALGAAVGLAAVFSDAPLLVVPAMVLLGIGNGAAQLSRYAAADLYPPDRRGLALSAVVWAGTIGAVVGPALISPATETALSLGLPSFSGVFLVALVVTFGASLAMSGAPRISSQADQGVRPKTGPAGRARLITHPRAKVALASMITGQITMVTIMTMTPLHMHQHGRGLGAIGLVLSAHALGMFALSPVTGWMTDRFGSSTTIVLGLAVLVGAALLAVIAPNVDGVALPVSMFLLGYGWNLTHVGGSSLLTHGLPVAEQTRLQGAVDSVVWAVSAVATLGSGIVFAIGGLSLLAVVGGSLVIYPVVVLTLRKNELGLLGAGYLLCGETTS
jgi:MFS family permease